MSLMTSIAKLEKAVVVKRQVRPIPSGAFILPPEYLKERGIYVREEDGFLCYKDEKTQKLTPFEGGYPILPLDPSTPVPGNLTYAL